MAAHGFSDEHLSDGWRRLRAATEIRTDVRARATSPDRRVAIDSFENRWFPLAKAALQHRHPQVHDFLFLNLPQKTGDEVALTVATFVRRVRQLERGVPELPEAAVARALLAERGLLEETLGEVEILITSLEMLEPMAPASTSREQQRVADEQLWAWYLEWSTVARLAVTDRRYLRALGFGRRGSKATDDEEEPSSGIPAAGSVVGSAAAKAVG